MKITISPQLKRLVDVLSRSIYLVGGSVRNGLLGIDDGDIDICGDFTTQEICHAAKQCGYQVAAVYPRTATVRIKADGEHYEYSALRQDLYRGGQHTPYKVVFTSDMEKDALRRDFTVNAIYFDLRTHKLCDPLNGRADIQKRLLRQCAPTTFYEDGLRLMRLVRLAAETGFYIERQTLQSARKNAALIEDISRERIYEELLKTLNADGRYPSITKGKPAHFRGLLLMYYTGLMQYVLPEVYACRGILQPPAYHAFDVFMHTLYTVRHAPPSVRLAALFHDTGKAVTYRESGNFLGHATHSAQLCQQALLRLGAPKKVRADTVFWVKNHMYDGDGLTSEKKLRLFLVENLALVPQLMQLVAADRLATAKSPQKDITNRWAALLQTMQTDKTPFSVKDLQVTAKDIIALGASGEQIGSTLSHLHRLCIHSPQKNQHHTLIQEAKGFLRSKNSHKRQ